MGLTATKQEMLDHVRLRFRSMEAPKRILALAYAAFFLIVLLTMSILTFGHHLLPAFAPLPTVPRLRLHYGPESPYDPRKVALLIENRPMGHLAPLLLHFTAVIPPDWRVRFMGSAESVSSIASHPAIVHQTSTLGRMDLTLIPSNMSVTGQEEISTFLTTLWVYETLLQPAEWLLVFQTDSMLCANSARSLNEWLDYDWVGAPWNPADRYGGNGGLSLRRVSAIVEVLRNQIRTPLSDPEDKWLGARLGQRVGAKVANGTLEMEFSGEMLTTRRPMGYHTGGGGTTLHGANWGNEERRRELYEYCPEVKMMVDMDAAAFMPGTCLPDWKRGEEALGAGERWPVPEGLVAW